MYCHQCGTQLPTEANFCAKCGTKVVSATLPPADQRPEASTPTNEDTRATVQPAAIASPVTLNVKVLVLRHILGMGLVALVNPLVWRSPTFMFAAGAVMAPWVITIVVAAIVTAVGYAFFTDAMKTQGVQVFLWTGWIFTALALIGRLLT
jgi:hypothetical protein